MGQSWLSKACTAAAMADSARQPVVKVKLGLLKKDETATISLAETTIRASSALPAAIEQRDSQFLLWKSNTTYVESWYQSEVERVKIR
jgi:oligosaccharyltransferase complex subunit alpha (ribophorin I)